MGSPNQGHHTTAATVVSVWLENSWTWLKFDNGNAWRRPLPPHWSATPTISFTTYLQLTSESCRLPRIRRWREWLQISVDLKILSTSFQFYSNSTGCQSVTGSSWNWFSRSIPQETPLNLQSLINDYQYYTPQRPLIARCVDKQEEQGEELSNQVWAGLTNCPC